MVCWKVGIEGASYQTLERRPPRADGASMRRFAIALVPLVALLAAACGGAGTSAVDAKVKAAMIAQQGRRDVASVDCTTTPPPAQTVAGGGSVQANRTCTISFNDGQPKQQWAVQVLDLEVSHPVQLLYRIGGAQNAAAPGVDIAKAYASELAVVDGVRVKRARCIAASPPAPAGTTLAGPPDHVCAARVGHQGVERWAVRTVGTGVQLLFRVT
jgi:hypothetical protein